jgi:hypothetical protein
MSDNEFASTWSVAMENFFSFANMRKLKGDILKAAKLSTVLHAILMVGPRELFSSKYKRGHCLGLI